MAALVAFAYHVHMWIVWRTARVEVIGCDRLVEALKRDQRVALALWHENLIMSIYGAREFRPATLASKSDIGNVISAILERVGFHVFRGGTSRSKTRRTPVLKDLVAYFKNHKDVLLAITVDGSAGPARKMKPGIIAMAEQSAAPIFVIHTSCRPCFRIWTWDRTCFPLAFGKVVVLFEGPIPAPRPGISGFRKARDQTDLLLRDTAKRADAYLRTRELPPPDPALELGTDYGEYTTRRGAKLFPKGATPVTPKPIDQPEEAASAPSHPQDSLA